MAQVIPDEQCCAAGGRPCRRIGSQLASILVHCDVIDRSVMPAMAFHLREPGMGTLTLQPTAKRAAIGDIIRSAEYGASCLV